MTLPKILQGNLSIPVIGSPLFLVSGPELVIAQCKAGIVGSFPALNARPQHVLDEWIVRIKEELAAAKEENPNRPIAPFAVNQICHASNDRLMADMESCVKHEVPIIITSLRPPEEIVANPATPYVREFVNDVPRAKVLSVKTVTVDGQTVSGGRTVASTAKIETIIPMLLERDEPIAVVDTNNLVIGVVNRQSVASILQAEQR